MPFKNKSHAERQRDSRIPTPDDRPTAAARGYGSRWQTTRRRHLRNNPLCVECKTSGFVVQAKEVDHIIPLGTPGGPGDVPGNRQSLCGMHHRTKTAGERKDGRNGYNNQPGGRGPGRSYDMEGITVNTKQPRQGVGGGKYL